VQTSHYPFRKRLVFITLGCKKKQQTNKKTTRQMQNKQQPNTEVKRFISKEYLSIPNLSIAGLLALSAHFALSLKGLIPVLTLLADYSLYYILNSLSLI